MSEVLGDKSLFEPKVKEEEKNIENVTPNEGEQPKPEPQPNDVQKMTDAEYQEYLKLKKYKEETEDVIQGLRTLPEDEKIRLITKMSGQQPNNQQYPTQPQQPQFSQPPSPQQPQSQEISDEEREFLETFPGAKKMYEENKKLKTLEQTINSIQQNQYQMGVAAKQKEIANTVERIKTAFPDLQKGDIDNILYQASGMIAGNPTKEVDLFNLGTAYAERLGLKKKEGVQANENSLPVSGAGNTGAPQNEERTENSLPGR